MSSTNRGRLLVLEGVDYSGKSTQQEMLVSRLVREGIPAMAFSFPRRDGPIGRQIDAYLKGEMGGKEALPMEAVSLLYELDRYTIREEISRTLDSGITVVLSRYWYSNVAFQAAKLPAGRARRAAERWLENLAARMPKPDDVVLLDVPPTTLRARMKGRGTALDVHERDLAYQCTVARIYRRLARKWNWHVVDAGGTIEDIHLNLWMQLSPSLLFLQTCATSSQPQKLAS
jgi:dTMP kinase